VLSASKSEAIASVANRLEASMIDSVCAPDPPWDACGGQFWVYCCANAWRTQRLKFPTARARIVQTLRISKPGLFPLVARQEIRVRVAAIVVTRREH